MIAISSSARIWIATGYTSLRRDWLMASLPGLTRQSISFAKTLTKLMDARVKARA
jgi:hypothetical protein